MSDSAGQEPPTTQRELPENHFERIHSMVKWKIVAGVVALIVILTTLIIMQAT